LAVRLTDDHISDILLCFERYDNRIKKFRLTNCINVIGKGMRRLRGSSAIEQIDLSMVPDHKLSTSWNLGYGGRLSFHHVVGTLDSIISLQQQNSLKYLHLPWYWRSCPLKPHIDQFMIRYERLWENRDTFCARCTCEFKPRICGGDTYGRTVVMQLNTCSICMKHYCFECNGEDGKPFITFCERCERVHCQDCMKMEHCVVCYEGFCQNHCGGSEVWKKNHGKECSGCDQKICGRCCFERTCSRCNETDCGVCRSYQVLIRRSQDYYEVRKHVEECEIYNLTWCRSCKDWKECEARNVS